MGQNRGPISVIPMSHDTRFRNHKSTPFSGAGFWYVCHANLPPNSSGTRLEHCSIPSQKDRARHVTEMMTYDWSTTTAYVLLCFSCFNYKLRIHRLRRFQPCLFSAPEIFIPNLYGTTSRRRKPAPENALTFWSMRQRYKRASPHKSP